MQANRWLILLGVAIPTLMIEMAGTSVFVAMETITTDLNVSIDRSVWLTTMYLSTNAMMLPLAGWLGKKLGYKRVIILSTFIFTFSALLGGLANNFEVLVLFRAIQGLGDGPIIPITTALLFETFPIKERGRMMVGIMLAIGIAPALGPLTASWIVEEIGWRGIFYMNVFLGLLSLISVTTLIPSAKPTVASPKVNWLGFMLLAVGTGSLQLFLDRGQLHDWFASGPILGLFIVAGSALAIYLILTLHRRDGTVLELRLLKDPAFLTGNMANMLLLGMIYGALMLKVLYLQWMMGYTSRYVGVYQAVMAGSMLLASLVAGYLNDKAHPRWPVLLGLPICVYGIYLASRLTLHHDLPGILRMGVILGVGAAFIMVPLSVAVFATISHRDMGAATVLNSYLSVVSGGISLALVTALLMHRIDVNAAHLSRAVMPDNPAVTAVMRLAGADLAQPMLYEQVMRQSAMFAFNDVLYLMSFILPLLLIYLPFMKKAPTGDDNEA